MENIFLKALLISFKKFPEKDGLWLYIAPWQSSQQIGHVQGFSMVSVLVLLGTFSHRDRRSLYTYTLKALG